MPCNAQLTKRQRQVLEWLIQFVREHGYPPTMREIAQGLGLRSVNAAYKHLMALQRKGYIKLHRYRSRGIGFHHRLLNLSIMGISQLPIIGRIAAGKPVLAEENWEGTLIIDATIANGNGDTFVVRVRGDSMRDMGIFDGDYAIIRPQPIAERGDVICALIEDPEPEVTLKGYFPEDNHVRLQPANPMYQPIILPRDGSVRWRILGKVVGIVRKGIPKMRSELHE